MKKEIKVVWEIDDGYAGGARPHYTYIPFEDWDECETDEEKETLVQEYVEQDFLNITWYVVKVQDDR